MAVPLEFRRLESLVSDPRVKPSASKRKPKLPRVPLPRQTGGRHEDKTRRPLRKQKHRTRPSGDE